LRVVAGFGKIHWVSREAYAPPASDLATREEALVSLLNARHGNDLRVLWGGGGSASRQAEIIGLDCDGFDVRAGGNIVRHDFDRSIAGADEVCAALTGIIRSARTR
jgi:hypothetical protein